MPTWLVCATAFYLPDYLGPRKFSQSLIDLIGDITINWDFWLHDELTFWYVPAIMLLYLLAPLYMKLISRHSEYRWTPVLMIVWCIMVQWVLPIHHAVGHLEIFWSRVPIFFIGINCGEMVRTERRERSAIRIPAHQLAAIGIRQSAEIHIVRSDLHETLHTWLANQKRISPYRCG